MTSPIRPEVRAVLEPVEGTPPRTPDCTAQTVDSPEFVEYRRLAQQLLAFGIVIHASTLQRLRLSLVHETVAQLALSLPLSRAEAEYIVGQCQWTEDCGPLSLTGLLAGEDDVVNELCDRVVYGPWWTELVEAMGAGTALVQHVKSIGQSHTAEALAEATQSLDPTYSLWPAGLTLSEASDLSPPMPTRATELIERARSLTVHVQRPFVHDSPKFEFFANPAPHELRVVDPLLICAVAHRPKPDVRFFPGREWADAVLKSIKSHPNVAPSADDSTRTFIDTPSAQLPQKSLLVDISVGLCIIHVCWTLPDMRRESMRIAVVFREQQATASFFLRSPLTHRIAIDHVNSTEQSPVVVYPYGVFKKNSDPLLQMETETGEQFFAAVGLPSNFELTQAPPAPKRLHATASGDYVHLSAYQPGGWIRCRGIPQRHHAPPQIDLVPSTLERRRRQVQAAAAKPGDRAQPSGPGPAAKPRAASQSPDRKRQASQPRSAHSPKRTRANLPTSASAAPGTTAAAAQSLPAAQVDQAIIRPYMQSLFPVLQPTAKATSTEQPQGDKSQDAPSDSSASMQDIPSGDTATTGIAMLQGGIKRTSTLSGPLYIAEVTPASEASGNGDCFPDSVAILAMQSGKQSSLSLRQKLCALVREAYGDWQRYYYGVPNSIELSPEANATQEGVIMWAKAPDGFKDQVQLKGWNTPGARFAGFLENQSKGGQWLNVSDAFFFATILDRDIFVLDTGFRNGGANPQIHLYRSGRARLSQQEVDTLVRDDVFIGADQQAEPGRAILCFYNGRDHFEPSLDRVIPMDAVAPDPLTLKTIRRAMKTLTVRSFLGTCQRVNEGEDPDRHAFELTLSAENLEVLESLGNGDL